MDDHHHDAVLPKSLIEENDPDLILHVALRLNYLDKIGKFHCYH
jgi:hypothetical protein